MEQTRDLEVIGDFARRISSGSQNETQRSTYEERYQVSSLNLVNQAVAFRMYYKGNMQPDGSYAVMEPKEVIDAFATRHIFVQRTPKTFSCICLRINETTLTVSTGGEANAHLRVNVAGKNGHESFIYTLQLLATMVEEACEKRISFTFFASKIVNNVIIMNLSRPGISVERLIDANMDELKDYNPSGFPGANFLSNASDEKGNKDCKTNIVFNTGNVTFLGVKDTSLFAKILFARLRVYRKHLSANLATNSKVRHMQRVATFNQWTLVKNTTN